MFDFGPRVHEDRGDLYFYPGGRIPLLSVTEIFFFELHTVMLCRVSGKSLLAPRAAIFRKFFFRNHIDKPLNSAVYLIALAGKVQSNADTRQVDNIFVNLIHSRVPAATPIVSLATLIFKPRDRLRPRRNDLTHACSIEVCFELLSRQARSLVIEGYSATWPVMGTLR